jgi:AraC-like DNA-binding protein
MAAATIWLAVKIGYFGPIMSTPNPVLSTIIVVFALQAILLSALLVGKRPRKQSNIFLALLVFFFALMALNIAWINILLSEDLFYVFRYTQLELMFGIGPALYFYTKSITDQGFRFSGKDYVHFIPLVVEFLFYRTAYYRLGADGMYQTPPHPYTPIYLTEQWLGILSITVYTFLALRLLIRHQRWLKQQYSNLEQRSQNWLKVPVLVYACYWIGWNILTEVDRFFFDRALRDYYFLPTFVGLAIVTYWIGFKGYLQTNKVQAIASKKPDPPKVEDQINPESVARINQLMKQEKAYLDPDLSLSSLAEQLGMNPKQVSATINQGFSQNFYEYVNQYRVEAFKERLQAPDSDQLTLLGHAFECGFASKSTFNHVFKKMTGKTPSAYAKSLKK